MTIFLSSLFAAAALFSTFCCLVLSYLCMIAALAYVFVRLYPVPALGIVAALYCVAVSIGGHP